MKLGVENREALEEIPIDSDFRTFFREFASPTVGYWHDTGHAQIKENLGFVNHEETRQELRIHRLSGLSLTQGHQEHQP